MKKDLMTRDLKRHALVQDTVTGFVQAQYELHDSHAYATGYMESLLVQILTYHVTEANRARFLDELARSADRARVESAYRALTLAA
jgi:hypothetical protein